MKFPTLIFCFCLLGEAVYGQLPSNGSKIDFFCTNWGMDVPWDEFCRRVKAAGFDGVETWLPSSDAELKAMDAALQQHGLDLILLSAGSGNTFEAYLEQFVNNLKRAIARKPRLINCHTGKDHFTVEQNSALITAAAALARESGVKIVHETHRGRFSFAAHVTRDYLERLPELSLTLDISHWCNVHESMLADQPEAVAAALSRTGHIHVRVGHQQGPQVNDPRAPEWEGVLQQHLRWWDEVVERYRKADETLTMTTEFGPPAYLPVLPYTKQPVASQWDINVYMLGLLKSRYYP